MTPKPLAFKIAALSFSVMLAGGYVWYRSGGSLPFVSSAAAETPEAPPPQKDEPIEVPPEVLAAAEAQDAEDAKRSPAETRREILLSGSKSEAIFIPRKTEPQIGGEAPRIPDPTVRREILMEGSKSGGFRPEPPPQPQRETRPEPPKRTVLPGSKSAAVVVEREVAQPAPAEQRQRQQQAAPQTVTPATPKRTILPGSKSMRIDVAPEPRAPADGRGAQ